METLTVSLIPNYYIRNIKMNHNVYKNLCQEVWQGFKDYPAEMLTELLGFMCMVISLGGLTYFLMIMEVTK